MRRGSTLAIQAPRRLASRSHGTRWMFEPLGLAPQTTMARAWTKSGKATPGILPYIPSATSVAGTAQIVLASREAPSRAKNSSSTKPSVSSPFEPP